MASRSLYRPIMDYDSLVEGTVVWHPVKGEGKVTAKTSGYLFVFFVSSCHIDRISRDEVMAAMGTR